ncbi:MAG TPA: protein-export chaperone SecB [Rhizobiales bacterium]|nr:protein-export chaperone SecB [Hyphomicrobiales bacterium]
MAKATKKPVKKPAKKAPKPAAAATNGGADESAASDSSGQQGQPSMNIIGQYLKDLSFENPNAPQSLAIQDGQPEINISVNVNAKNLAPTDYEVELHIEAQAKHQGNTVFAAELLYAGVFRLENIPQEAIHPVILVECPRLIFPFARQILADATRNGGFPPLMLDPIDFAGMYQKRLEEGKAQG